MRCLPLLLAICAARGQSPEVQSLVDESRTQNDQQHFDLATQLAKKAVDLSLANADSKGLARAYTSLSNAYYNWRKLEPALVAAKQGEAIAAEAGDQEYRIRNLLLAGSSLRDQGKLDEASAYYNRALDFCKTSGDKTREASTLRMMAALYRMSGEYSRAVPLALESLRITRAIRDGKLEALALNLLGVLEFEQKRVPKALEYFHAAFKLPSADTLLTEQILDGLAACYCSLEQLGKCQEFTRQNLDLAIAAKNNSRIANGYQRLADIQRQAGAFENAHEMSLRALAYLRSADHSPFDEWGFVQGVAESLRDLGRDRDAAPYFLEGIAIVERLREGAMPTEQGRALSAAYAKPLFDGAIDTLFGIDQSRAIQLVELSRARAFLSILAESKVDLRQDLSPSGRDRETALFARISAAQKDLWRPDLTPAAKKTKTSELESAENDLERLHLEIRRANPRLAAVQYPKALGLAEIQQTILKPGTTLIEFHLGEKRSFVWAISRERSKAAILPPAKEIETLATALRKNLTTPVSALTLKQSEREAVRLAAALYRMLLKPVEDLLAESKSIIVVPDGVLYYVPFEYLSESAKQGYLIHRFPVSYAPSATSLADLDQTASPARAEMLIAFGDPASAALGALPYTRDEVNGIAALFPKGTTAVYLGAGAREDVVKNHALDRYRYIHFATHGILDEKHPSRSGLALTPSRGDDGLLQVDEIARLRITADLVTLSACNTGLGELVSGEGMLGLVRAFLYAGAARVAVSLWSVNDAATAKLMKEFYRQLSLSVPPEEALRRAKIALVRDGANSPWRHPHYWAPFVLWLR